MQNLNTYILEKFKISKDIGKESDKLFYILIPVGAICTYYKENYPNNFFKGKLVNSLDFNWTTVFVFYWDDIEEIFTYFKHKMPDDFRLSRFLIYDILNIKSYLSMDDFLDKVQDGKVSGVNFQYNGKYTKELDERIK